MSMEENLKQTIKKYKMALWTSISLMVLGPSTTGVSQFLPIIEAPKIYIEHVQTKQDMNYLNSVKSKIEKLTLGKSQQKLLHTLDEIIKEQNVKEIKADTKIQEYCELKNKEDKKQDALWYGGAGLTGIGYLGFGSCLFWNSRIRKKHNQNKKANFNVK